MAWRLRGARAHRASEQMLQPEASDTWQPMILAQ